MTQKLNNIPQPKYNEGRYSIPALWNYSVSLFFPSEIPSPLDPKRCQVLPHHVEERVAREHIQQVYTPLYSLTDKEIEQLPPDAVLGEVLDHLSQLSLLEKGIEEWKEKHQVTSVSTPSAVHVLYSKLFAKVERTSGQLLLDSPLPNHATSLPCLVNASGTNCFINVVLQTLFSNLELAKTVVLSRNQSYELKAAFLLFKKASLSNDQTPIDLASALRPHYPQIEEEGQHDAAELLTLMMKGAEVHALSVKTAYSGSREVFDQLEGLDKEGTRTQEVREAVCTLPLQGEEPQLLEELLFHTFNEIVTDTATVEFETKDHSNKVRLPRTFVQTRYISAPKFLIFNVCRASLNKKENVPIGLQHTFYLSGKLTTDNQGARYSLQSFNVHRGEDTTSGHYLHYRKEGEKYFYCSDDQIEKVSEIEYLLAAQRAYVIVLQKEGDASLEEINEGITRNLERTNALYFINNILCALEGLTFEFLPCPPIPLQKFIESLIAGKPSKEDFATLDLEMRNFLLELWSKSGCIEDMVETIQKQTKQPVLSKKRLLEGYFFSYGIELTAMMDLLALRALAKPEEKPNDPLSQHGLIIAAVSSISQKIKSKILLEQRVIHEVGNMVLTVGVAAFKLFSTKKDISFSELRKDSSVRVQAISSIFSTTQAYADPKREGRVFSYAQLGMDYVMPFVMPLMNMKKEKENSSLTSLLSPTSSFLLKLFNGSSTSKSLVPSLAPVLADAVIPSLQEARKSPNLDLAIISTFGKSLVHYLQFPENRQALERQVSAILSISSQGLKRPLQGGEDNPLHYHSRSRIWRATLVHILMENSSIHSLISGIATDRIAKKNHIPPLQQAYKEKSEDLNKALEGNDKEKVKKLTNELKRIGERIKSFGYAFDPKNIDDFVDQKQLEQVKKEELKKLTTEERKELRDKKYESLKEALLKNDQDASDVCYDDILLIEDQLRQEGVNLDSDPQNLKTLMNQFNDLVKKFQEYNRLRADLKKAEVAQDQSEVDRLTAELEKRLPEIQALCDQVTPEAQTSAAEAETLITSHVPSASVSVQPPSLSMTLSIMVKDNEYCIYLKNGESNSKQIGKFSNKESAEYFQKRYEDYFEKLNKQNREVAQFKAYFKERGLGPADIERLHFFKPIYVEISSCGTKSKVYKGSERTLTTKNKERALTESIGLMEAQTDSNALELHEYKTMMSDEIFSMPGLSEAVKMKEKIRIINEQQQHIHDIEGLSQKQTDFDQQLKVAKSKRTNKAENQRRGLQIDRDNAAKQIVNLRERIDDNNFTLEIAEGNTTREEVNRVKKAYKDAKSAMPSIKYLYKDSTERYEKKKTDEYYKLAKRAASKLNSANTTLQEATEQYYRLQGLDYKASSPEEVEGPTRATKWEKTKAWLNNNVSGSGEVNVVTVSGPGAPPQPSLVHFTVSPQNNKPTTSYAEGRHQVQLESEEVASSQPSRTWTFEDTQALEREKSLRANMAYRSAPSPVNSHRLPFASEQNSHPYVAPAPTQPTETYRSTFARDLQSQPYASSELPLPAPTPPPPPPPQALPHQPTGLLRQQSLLDPTLDPFQIRPTDPAAQAMEDLGDFWNRVKEEHRAKPVATSANIVLSVPVGIGTLIKESTKIALIGQIPGVPQALDRIGEWGENNYLVVLEFFQVPMDRDSAGYKLGKEIGCWVAPISSGKKGPQQLAKAVKYTPAEFTQKMSKLYQEAGVHISEPELAKAMGQAFEKELTTQTAFKKLAQEFELQTQKKGVPKTVPSATKVEGSTSRAAEESRKVKLPARTKPRNLHEQIALQEAKAGAGEIIRDFVIKDKKYVGGNWEKIQYYHKNPDGSKISIHYWKNKKTSETHGFKFKDNPN